MRRSLNYKFLLGLLAGTAVFGTGVHFLHAYQVRRNAGALLTRAEQAEKAEKAAAEAIYKTRDGLVRTNFYGDETSDQQDADYTGKDAFVTREQVLELLWAERERSDALLVEALEAVGSTIEAAFDKLERMPDEFETLLTPVKADILQLRARVDLLRSERAGVAPSSDGTVPRRFN